MTDVVIVDDEPLAAQRLRDMVGAIEGFRVVGLAHDGRAALEAIQHHQPGLVLLDVQMPEMDGLELAHHLQTLEHPPAVVFCTAYDQYALDAFNAQAVDYIVKPVRQQRLHQALDKVERFSGQRTAPPKPERRTHLCARLRGNLELVSVDSIICLIAEHKYVTVVHDGGEVLIEEPLVALEEEFSDRFLRVHRNALVALDRVTGLDKCADGGTAVRLEGTEHRLNVSRRNLPAVRKVIRKL